MFFKNGKMFRYQVVSGIRLNFTVNISVFEIGETGVKTLERELKSCLTGLTSRAFICRLPDLFQFYLNQWKHIHVQNTYMLHKNTFFERERK